MARYTGAQILIKTLEERGVENIFGYPGAAILSVYDALPSSSIKHILCTDEQGAAFAAEGYARSSFKAGVCLATSGPGATNLLTGLADAYMDSVPMVAITGNVNLEDLGHDSFQEVDIFDMAMPVTKYSIIITKADDIAPLIRKAFTIAESGRKGPVLVDIPKSVLDETGTYEKEPSQKFTHKDPSPEEISAAVSLIKSAEKPVIYVGGGVKFSGAEKEVKILAEKLNCPVVTSFMGIGSFDQSSPLYAGVLSNENLMLPSIFKECDLFITLGARFNSRFNAFNTLKKRKIAVLQIDADRAEIDKNILTTASVLGDIKEVLSKVNPEIEQREMLEWAYKEEELPEDTNRGIQIICALSEKLKDSVTVSTDVGLHQIWTALNYKFLSPNKFLTSGGLGAMGFSIGAAIGSHFATGGKQLIITGDGSFNMNFNELLTCVKYHIPVIIVVLNNNSLGLIRLLQYGRKSKGYMASSLYLNTDYVKLAESMGARGIVINETDDINEKLNEALNGSLPVVIDCRISINEGIH
ncbi:MAG: thiamine pyrophosphate-binding protein [Clostridia bacterium]|nr:thiamine pyrophosphate-binding protein [Clostridia bacterium]